MDEQKTQENPQQQKLQPTKRLEMQEAAEDHHPASLEDSKAELTPEMTPEDAVAAIKDMPMEERIGTPSPFQLAITLGKETLRSLVFDKDLVTIGRDAKCDVLIDNLGASRVHAQIERIGKFYLLRDLSSKTGTFVHGRKIEEHCLNLGDEIFLAKHTLVFQKLSSARWHRDELVQNARPMMTPKGIPRQQMMQTMAVDFRDMAKKQGPAPAQLNMLGMNRRLPITKTALFFGKSSHCDFSVTGFLIGDRHVALIQEEKGFMLYHLGLFKPPRVNNKLVESALLENGDMIQIGELKFILQLSEKEA